MLEENQITLREFLEKTRKSFNVAPRPTGNANDRDSDLDEMAAEESDEIAVEIPRRRQRQVAGFRPRAPHNEPAAARRVQVEERRAQVEQRRARAARRNARALERVQSPVMSPEKEVRAESPDHLLDELQEMRADSPEQQWPWLDMHAGSPEIPWAGIDGRAESPKNQPEIPEYVPESPENQPESPEYEPETPEFVPDSPEYELETPEYVPNSPEYELESTEDEPESTDYQPESPEDQQESPQAMRNRRRIITSPENILQARLEKRRALTRAMKEASDVMEQ
jgi:hypothetical protein